MQITRFNHHFFVVTEQHKFTKTEIKTLYNLVVFYKLKEDAWQKICNEIALMTIKPTMSELHKKLKGV